MISRIVSFILLPIRLVIITKLFSQCSVLNRRIHDPEWPRQKIKQNFWSLAIHRSNTLMKIYRCCSHHKCPLLACRSPYIAVALHKAPAKNDLFSNRAITNMSHVKLSLCYREFIAEFSVRLALASYVTGTRTRIHDLAKRSLWWSAVSVQPLPQSQRLSSPRPTS